MSWRKIRVWDLYAENARNLSFVRFTHTKYSLKHFLALHVTTTNEKNSTSCGEYIQHREKMNVWKSKKLQKISKIIKNIENLEKAQDFKNFRFFNFFDVWNFERKCWNFFDFENKYILTFFGFWKKNIWNNFDFEVIFD